MIQRSNCYRDAERLVRLRDEDRILMFQVEPPPSPSQVELLPLRYGFLYHRVESSLTGDPLLFTFNANTTCLECVSILKPLLSLCCIDKILTLTLCVV